MKSNVERDDNLFRYFDGVVKSLVEEYKGTQTLLLFQGVGKMISEIVFGHPAALPAPDSGWFDEDGFIDIGRI